MSTVEDFVIVEQWNEAPGKSRQLAKAWAEWKGCRIELDPHHPDFVTIEPPRDLDQRGVRLSLPVLTRITATLRAVGGE